jgi:hypothetical protein
MYEDIGKMKKETEAESCSHLTDVEPDSQPTENTVLPAKKSAEPVGGKIKMHLRRNEQEININPYNETVTAMRDCMAAMRDCMADLVLARGIKMVIGFLNSVKRWTWS